MKHSLKRHHRPFSKTSALSCCRGVNSASEKSPETRKRWFAKVVRRLSRASSLGSDESLDTSVSFASSGVSSGFGGSGVACLCSWQQVQGREDTASHRVELAVLRPAQIFPSFSGCFAELAASVLSFRSASTSRARFSSSACSAMAFGSKALKRRADDPDRAPEHLACCMRCFLRALRAAGGSRLWSSQYQKYAAEQAKSEDSNSQCHRLTALQRWGRKQ